jgi:hypothetical protein
MYDGMIARVTPNHVLLVPMGRGVTGEKKDGTVYEANTAELNHEQPEGTEILFGWWIPFVAIATLALFPFFFWW